MLAEIKTPFYLQFTYKTHELFTAVIKLVLFLTVYRPPTNVDGYVFYEILVYNDKKNFSLSR